MRRHLRLFTALGLFLFVSHALPVHADEGDDALERGLRLFNGGELKAAEKVLQRAAELLPAGAGRAKALLHLGLTKAYREKFGSAKRDFVRALTEDPTVMIDKERVPPPVRDAFAEAHSTVTGTLAIEGGPTGATAEIDGAAKGALPQSQSVKVGEHTVRILSADGKELVSERVILKAGEKKVVRAETEVVAVVTPKPTPAPIAAPMPVVPPVVKRVPPPPKALEPLAGPIEPSVEPSDAKTISEPLATLPPLPSEPLKLTKEELGLGGGDDPALPTASWFTPRRVLGVFTLSAGVVSAFVGMGYGLAAKGAEDEFQRARQSGTIDQVLQFQRDAQDRSKYSNVFLVVGASLVAVGAVVTLWPATAEKPASAKLVPTAGGAMLAVDF